MNYSVSSIGLPNNGLLSNQQPTRPLNPPYFQQFNSHEDHHGGDDDETMNSAQATVDPASYANTLNSPMMNSAMNYQQSAQDNQLQQTEPLDPGYYPQQGVVPYMPDESVEQVADPGSYSFAAQELPSPEPMRPQGKYINPDNLKGDMDKEFQTSQQSGGNDSSQPRGQDITIPAGTGDATSTVVGRIA